MSEEFAALAAKWEAEAADADPGANGASETSTASRIAAVRQKRICARQLRQALSVSHAQPDPKPVVIVWDQGERTTDHIDEIAAAVRVMSGGRVIISHAEDSGMSDDLAVVATREVGDEEAIQLWLHQHDEDASDAGPS